VNDRKGVRWEPLACPAQSFPKRTVLESELDVAILKRSVARQISLLFGFWVALSIVALLNLLPWMPRSKTQWLAVMVLGPPIILGAEYLGDKCLEARFLSPLPSWLRISLTVAAVVTVAVAVAILVRLAS
jgi:hypothetical protein